MFLALWPDTALRAAMVERTERARLVREFGGRRVPAHNLHLTLVFLGNVAAERVDALIDEVGQSTPPGPFTLRLDRFGTFPPARVAWLGAAPVPAALALVEMLIGVACRQGLRIDARSWRPHVTLVRGIDARPSGLLPALDEPIDWAVRDFALIESIPGRPYQVLRTWPVE
nr:RNA 2',3'-cyclic phosphodiesterase [Wenzhouxiangella sp. XN79A]